MRASTYFSAYKRAGLRMWSIAERRQGGDFGIAVDGDRLAVRWQRYDRLLTKLHDRLVAIHAEYDAR